MPLKRHYANRVLHTHEYEAVSGPNSPPERVSTCVHLCTVAMRACIERRRRWGGKVLSNPLCGGQIENRTWSSPLGEPTSLLSACRISSVLWAVVTVFPVVGPERGCCWWQKSLLLLLCLRLRYNNSNGRKLLMHTKAGGEISRLSKLLRMQKPRPS